MPPAKDLNATYSVSNADISLENTFLNKGTEDASFTIIYSPALASNQAALKEIFDALTSNTTEADKNTLLNIALKYNPVNGSGVRLATVAKNADGTYTATAATGPAVTSATTVAGLARHLSIPYFALAMAFEMSLAVKGMLAAQAQAILENNELTKKNNSMLRYANSIYLQTYNHVTNSGGGSHTYFGTNNGITWEQWKPYVEGDCKFSLSVNSDIAQKQAYRSWYDKEGSSGAGYENIDVKEQAELTTISNAQEAIRMHGDEIGTVNQQMNTKLNQFTQTYNSFSSIASQLVKSLGDYIKGVANNVRL
ncbi:MAG: hypothetical protein LBJ94_04035 [Puniceicoccales bacterium]|jgi:hypothetical protein|nr:hypothetical protein [Puniceicoccales bacterium]